MTKMEISSAMNKYFCSVRRDLAGKRDESQNPLSSSDYNINPLESIFVFKSIQVQHVTEAVGRITSSKSLEDGNISSYFLKLAFRNITGANLPIESSIIQSHV